MFFNKNIKKIIKDRFNYICYFPLKKCKKSKNQPKDLKDNYHARMISNQNLIMIIQPKNDNLKIRSSSTCKVLAKSNPSKDKIRSLKPTSEEHIAKNPSKIQSNSSDKIHLTTPEPDSYSQITTSSKAIFSNYYPCKYRIRSYRSGSSPYLLSSRPNLPMNSTLKNSQN